MPAAVCSRLTAVLLGLAAAGPAIAADPVDAAQAVVDSDGRVSIQVQMDVPAAMIRRVLGDSRAALGLSPDVLGASSTVQGRCEQVSVETRGMFSPMTYVVLRCPTSSGYTERLLKSEDFDAHEVDWSLQETEDGTLVTLRVRSEPKVPLPAAALRKVLIGSMKTSLRNLQDEAAEEE